MATDDDEIEDEQLVLGDLLNHVLDKGVVIGGTVTISVADIDLIVLDLRFCSRPWRPPCDETSIER